ncbi:FtsX-like permease family protein [uncultured Oscillibacter sp.]|uniref:FtsX-like permease family protein n=1 Tax=uncultured Oscillibacter sp. TaxID=876091 RepID=UPI0025E6CE9C|nr:FtsX-like permease family protein [uncultured Oscillibacter sp.]
MKLRHNRIITDALREIRNTFSRFLSLLVLSALAVCFLAGLRATAPDMKKSADLYFDQQNLMDLHVLSTLGLTDKDAEALAQQPGVAAVERAYTVDAVVHLTDNDYIVKVLSFTEDPGINAPRLVEGRLPQNARECLVEPLLLEETGLQLGDTLTLDTGGGDYADALRTEAFTIVGTADSPLYVGTDRGTSSLGTGKVSAFVLLPLSAFSMETYTDFYLLAEGAESLLCYDDAYTDQIDSLTDSLEAFADQRARLRGEEVIGEANEQLAEAEQELADAQAEAEQELSDAWAELADARAELDDGWAEYHDGVRELQDQVAEAEQEIADGQTELDDALVELNDNEQKLTDARAELDDGWQEYYDGRRDYEDGLDEYEDGYAQYEDGLEQYEDGLAEYRAGQRRLSSALDQLNDGEAQYSAGKSQFDQFAQQLWTAAIQAGLAGGYPSVDALLSAAAGGNAEAGNVLAAVMAGIHEQLNTQIRELEATLSGLNGELEKATQAVAALPGQITALEEQISQAEEAGASEEELAALRASLAELNNNLSTARESIPQLTAGISQAQSGLANLQAQVAQIPADGAAVIASYQTLLASRRELDDGWDEYYDGMAQLRAAKRELDDAKAVLDETEEELADGWTELEDARRQLEDAYQELQDGEQELSDGRAELDDGWQDYYDGLQELEDARQTLAEETADAQAELSDARAELNDGETAYTDGLAEYEDGRAEAEDKIADARKELEQARRDIEDIEECEWYLLGRNTNTGYVSYSMDADRMGNLASVFPLIFFLVAALVCLTTMTRMVEEQRVTIGGLKALGYSKGIIAVKYVGYGFLASTVGALLGLAVGLTLLPWIICNAWNIIYTLGPIQYGLEPVTSAVACLAAIGTVTLSALGACFSTLAAVPAQLMRPKAPPAGKRVLLERLPFLWRRLSFNYKITIRNLFRYQRRFWMTVIGIGGCAALIVTAFGLRGSIFDIMDKQFEEIYGYTAQIGLVDKVTPSELQEVTQALDENSLAEGYLVCRSESMTAETDAYTVDCALQVFSDQASMASFIHLRHRTGDGPVTLPDDGVVLTEKLASLLDVQPGDTITLDGDSRVEVRVADVTEHYIQHYVYMTDAYYETVFGTEPRQNLVLADYPVEDPAAEDLERELVGLDGVTSLTRMEDTREIYGSSLESVDYAVILIIVCAAALAFVVLYNLTNINITERMRELATLKVLGFYDGELSAYIYRENVILTVFGVAMGMVMGKLLHQWLIFTVEIDMLMFGRQLSLSSYAYAVVLTVLFSLLVNLAAHRKLKKLDMVESLKTVE